MKTIGERIRQAREARKWSAFDLARRVGYKTQSGISNLENRASGSGGNKIGLIARALAVPIDWLVNGPDGETTPFVPPIGIGQMDGMATSVAHEQSAELYQFNGDKEYDEWTLAAITLMQELDPGQRQAMVAKMREFRQFLGPPRDGQALQVAG